jgi:hypothetical protein
MVSFLPKTEGQRSATLSWRGKRLDDHAIAATRDTSWNHNIDRHGRIWKRDATDDTTDADGALGGIS